VQFIERFNQSGVILVTVAATEVPSFESARFQAAMARPHLERGDTFTRFMFRSRSAQTPDGSRGSITASTDPQGLEESGCLFKRSLTPRDFARVQIGGGI
jgi:hypothetical protein